MVRLKADPDASVAEVKAQLSAYLKESERLVLAHSPRIRSILETARQQIRRGEGVSHEKFWQEMETEKPRKPMRKSRGKSA